MGFKDRVKKKLGMKPRRRRSVKEEKRRKGIFGFLPGCTCNPALILVVVALVGMMWINAGTPDPVEIGYDIGDWINPFGGPINDTIDDKLNWVNDTCILYNCYWDASGNSSNTGLWNDVRNKYIGTKILVEDKALFGWIRVEITSGWNMTLIDYACTVGFELE